MSDIHDDFELIGSEKPDRILDYLNRRVDFEAQTLSMIKDRKSLSFFYHKGNYDTLVELANYTKRIMDE